MPNKLQTGDIGTQFLDLDCKRDPETSLDLWSQNILLFFLLGKGMNYTDEEKYVIMINTFNGKVNDWFSGLTEDAEKIIRNNTLEGLKNSLQEGITNLKQYVANEFFGGQGSIVSINKLFAYDKLETDLLLGNDFLQQFQDYHQTLYMISLKTPCGHFIKVPRKQNPDNLEKDNGNYKRKYLENLRKITCKCLNLEKIKENLQKSYSGF